MQQSTRNAQQLGCIALLTAFAVSVFAGDVIHGSVSATIMAITIAWFAVVSVAQVRRYRRGGQHELADGLLAWTAVAAGLLWVVADFGQVRLEAAREKADACLADRE